MGIWDFINSTTDQLKRNAPDLTPVGDACRVSYNYGSAAVAKVDNAFRVHGVQKLNQYWPDHESRAKIGLFTSKFIKNTALFASHEAFRCIPGGDAFSKIVSQTVREVKSELHNNQGIKALPEKKGGPEKDFGGSRKALDQQEMPKWDAELGSQHALSLSLDTNANPKPEDEISIFMMKGFIGSHILSDLMVPEIRKRREKHK